MSHVREEQIDELKAFGNFVDRGKLPAVGDGGVIELPPHGWRKEQGREGQGQADTQAGSAAGSRQRSSGKAAEAGETAHAIRSELGRIIGLERVVECYPGSKVLHHSRTRILLTAPVRILRSLAIQYRLVVEVAIPVVLYKLQLDYQLPERVAVPLVRGWLIEEPGVLIYSYHSYPDASLCAFMPYEWKLGTNELIDAMDWYVCWIGKFLYLLHYDVWPGPQHTSSYVRTRLDRPGEYCGCGKHTRYGRCHRDDDRARPLLDHYFEDRKARILYLCEAKRRGMSTLPPVRWTRKHALRLHPLPIMLEDAAVSGDGEGGRDQG